MVGVGDGWWGWVMGGGGGRWVTGGGGGGGEGKMREYMLEDEEKKTGRGGLRGTDDVNVLEYTSPTFPPPHSVL